MTSHRNLIAAIEQLKNVSKLIGYNEHLHELMWQLKLQLQDEDQNEQIDFKEVECD